MINWREFSEDGFRLVIPERLRRMRLGPMFKGNMTKGLADTELVVFFNPAVSASMVSDCHKACLKPPPFTEWEGLKWTYYIWGSSKTRADGFESKFTQTAPNPRGRGHRWGITFPINRKWVQLDATEAAAWNGRNLRKLVKRLFGALRAVNVRAARQVKYECAGYGYGWTLEVAGTEGVDDQLA